MGTALKLRARSREGYFQDFSFDLNIILPIDQEYPANTPFRYRVEIEGIDISSRLIRGNVSFQNALDLVRINKYTAANCMLPLRNNDGYFRNDIADNFWTTNDLNPGGFLNSVQVFVEFLDAGSWEPVLFFEGQITGLQTPLQEVSTLRCLSNTTRLTQIDLTRAGVGIEKIAELQGAGAENNEPVVEGTYTPEAGLAPLDAAQATEAYHHQDCLSLKDVVNDALGIKDNTGVLSPSDFKTQGGELGDPLLLRYKTAFRYKRVRDALEKITKIESHLTTLFPAFEDLPEVDAHISARGNIQFNTEAGRITRLPVDWIYNEATDRLYVLLSNPSVHIPDQLVEYRVDTDSSHILNAFDAELSAYRIATSDFDTFYILAGTSTDIDLSDPAIEDSETLALNYDSAVADSDIKILKFIRTECWTDTFIDSDDDYPPQLGIHYHFGFPNRDFAWQGNVASRQSAFLVNGGTLYYRYATDTAFGVASATSDGGTASLFSADKDGYENHLNFAFTFDADDNLYFAYAEGTTFGSTLQIKKRTGSTITTLASIERGILELTDIEDTGGAFLGVHEMVFSDDYLYMVVPVARGNREIDKSAGVVLYRYGVYSLTLEKIDSADFVHFGFAGLTVHDALDNNVHDDAVYYVQAPAEVYKYPAYNPEIDSYDAEDRQNYLPDFKGNLKRVLPTGEVEDCGAIRFDAEGAFRGLLCRCLTFDDSLHMIVAQGSADALLQDASETVSLPSGALWCVFGKQLNFIANTVPTTGTLDNALTTLSEKVNATLGLDRNIITTRNRLPVGALLDGTIDPNAETLDFKNANRTSLPSAGHVLIDSEILTFTGRTDTQLTGVSGGRLLTDAEIHFDVAVLTFLDEVIHPNTIIGDIHFSVDTQHIYNTIKDNNQLIRIKDELSVFSDKLLSLDLDLDNLQIPWLEFIAGNYLHRFKDIRFLVNITVQPSFGFNRLRIGDIVGFHYKDPIPAQAIQILQIQYNSNSTVIQGREATPDITDVADPILASSDDTYRLLDGAGDSILVDGDGDHILFVGAELNQEVIPITFQRLIEDVTWVQYEEIEEEIMPIATGGAGEKFTYTMEGLPDGVFFDPKTRRRHGTPDDAQSATEAILIATDKDGTTHQAASDITVTAATKETNRLLDGVGDSILVDGADNHIIFRGY